MVTNKTFYSNSNGRILSKGYVAYMPLYVTFNMLVCVHQDAKNGFQLECFLEFLCMSLYNSVGGVYMSLYIMSNIDKNYLDTEKLLMANDYAKCLSIGYTET